MVPIKWLTRLELVVEAWLSVPVVKESESTAKFWGLQRILELLCGDSEGRSVSMTLGRCSRLGHFLPMRELCPILFGVMYLLQLRLQLCLFVYLGMCRPEVRWCLVSDLILDLIHYVIIIIYLIPRFRHLYFLWTFLDPSETTITVMVSPIIIMMMSKESAVSNSGIRWELAMMMLNVKTPNLRQCPLLPVAPHSFSPLLIFWDDGS